MSDELQAALARAEAAEAEVKRLQELFRLDGEQHAARVKEINRVNEIRLSHYIARAEAAERQRNEAFTAGAEAMREACEKVSVRHGYQQVADEIFALPIPAQEGK